jgi:hypothetical protein
MEYLNLLTIDTADSRLEDRKLGIVYILSDETSEVREGNTCDIDT